MRYVRVVFVMALLGFSAGARATDPVWLWVHQARVVAISPENLPTIALQLNQSVGQCAANSWHWLQTGSNDQMKAFYALMLAAVVSGNPVDLATSGTPDANSRCTFVVAHLYWKP